MGSLFFLKTLLVSSKMISKNADKNSEASYYSGLRNMGKVYPTISLKKFGLN